MEVILNGKTVEAPAGITILDLAKHEGIHIPTLCHDEELKPFGSCWVCAVQVEGRRGFVTSCGTVLSPGMVISTDTPEIHNARKMALELLISNHYADCEAPCKIACPDHVDIQTYVSLIANGKYHEAVKVIKDTLPMPLSIGRVCPAFCEAECRRQIVEEPIAIRQLKRYAADEDLKDYWQYTPEKAEATGKKVAIIGGGPSGLTCGYYLSFAGFEVDLFEAEDACGGWLRYGIPEYRLPKAILDEEIALMCSGGMKIHYGKALGKDIALSELSQSYDAVYLALGAQNAVPMPVPGSDLKGCYLGVDFLKAHAKGHTPVTGKRVAIVGGGNTAIDCARTSIRLGCEVALIYRRTKEEMPAEPFEIEAAEHEGVVFYYLSNPVEYLGEDGVLKEVRIEKMRLGEPDSSGRRRPEPTGEYFTEAFDSIIAAISQVPEVKAFALPENTVDGKTLPISRWQTAVVDEATMHSGIANVFAGGDFQRGAATAIEAIADGRKASDAIQKFLLEGLLPTPKFVFDAKKAKKVQDVSPAEYAIFDAQPRKKMPEISLELAKSTFQEVELGFSEAEAMAEAARCVECGCQVNETCSLRSYCSEYTVAADRFSGKISHHPIDYSHPFIVRDANKCINCGRCIRTCAEIQGAAVLGFVYRGFSAIVAPEFGESLTQTTCVSCGKCIDVCPVGALVERNLHYKLNPMAKDKYLQNCGLCGTGCEIQAEAQACEVVRITTPEIEPGFNGKNLCFKGRFGWQAKVDKLQYPLLRKGDKFEEITYGEALEVIQTRLKLAKTKCVEITPHITLEEMLISASIAKNMECTLAASKGYFAFSDACLTLNPVENPYTKLDEYQRYVIVGDLNRTLLSLLRLQQMQGKHITLVDFPEDAPFHRFADTNLKGLKDIEIADNQLFIYNQNRISEHKAGQIWHLAKDAQNIMVSTDYMNHRGFLAMAPCKVKVSPVDFAICYGAEPASKADFKVAIASYKPDCPSCDLILPAPNYLEIEGIALGDNAKISRYHNPTRSNAIGELLRIFHQLNWIHPNTADLTHWNTMAEKMLADLEGHQPQCFSTLPDEVLKDVPIASDAPIIALMKSLYEMRSKAVKF